MFSIGERSTLQAGQFSTFYYEAMLLYSCSIWFCIVLLKYTSSGGEHMLLLNLYLPYSIHSAFQNMPIPYGQPTKVFGLVPYVQRFLQFL